MKEIEKKLDQVNDNMKEMINMFNQLTRANRAHAAGNRPTIHKGDYMRILPLEEGHNPFDFGDFEMLSAQAKKYAGKIVRVEYVDFYENSNRVEKIDAIVIGAKYTDMDLIDEKYSKEVEDFYGDSEVCGHFYPFELELLPSYTGIIENFS